MDGSRVLPCLPPLTKLRSAVLLLTVAFTLVATLNSGVGPSFATSSSQSIDSPFKPARALEPAPEDEVGWSPPPPVAVPGGSFTPQPTPAPHAPTPEPTFWFMNPALKDAQDREREEEYKVPRDREEALDEHRVNTFAVFNDNGAYRRSPMRGIALTTASNDCDQVSAQQLIARLAGTADDGAPDAEAAGVALAAAGFRTVWLDECWLPPRGERSPLNFDAIAAHPVTFSDGLAPIAAAAHAANLSLGVYVSASPYACGDAEREGSLDFYVSDAQALADAGVDAVRIDQCASPDDLSAIIDEIDGAGNLRESEHFRTSDSRAGHIIDQIRASDARKFVLAWNMTGREVWMNVRCADWRDEAGVRMEAPLWCRRAAHAVFGVPGLPRHAHSWRSTTHVAESLRQRTHFAIMEPQIDAGYVFAAGTEQAGEHSTEDEAEAALALMAVAGTPLILGSRLDDVSPRFLKAITNQHLLAIHGDPAMIAGDYVGNVNCTHKYLQGHWEVRDACQLWLKPLADGGFAALLFNADGDKLHTMNLDFVNVFGVPVRVDVLDIYGHLDEEWLPRTEFVQVDVRPRHAALVRLSPPHSVVYRKGGLPSRTPAPIPERDGSEEDD